MQQAQYWDMKLPIKTHWLDHISLCYTRPSMGLVGQVCPCAMTAKLVLPLDWLSADIVDLPLILPAIYMGSALRNRASFCERA